MQPYGVNETNPLDSDTREQRDAAIHSGVVVDWTEPGVTIDRLRLLSDPGFPAYDVSYCTGHLADGTPCRVQVPFDYLPKGKGRINRTILDWARRDRVFAKDTGIFDAISILN